MFSTNISLSICQSIKYGDLKHFNDAAFTEDLLNCSCHNTYNKDDINEKVLFLSNRINALFIKHLKR